MSPPLTLLITFILAPLPLVFLTLYRHFASRPTLSKTATILVLGDIGRSPRMMYHAQSLASHGYKVNIVAYDDTPPIASLRDNPQVRIRPIANPPQVVFRLPWVLRAPIRVLWQIGSVMRALCGEIPGWSKWVVVQNPPSVPTLMIVWAVQLLSGAKGVREGGDLGEKRGSETQRRGGDRGMKVVLDWHNTGWSILAMRTGERSPLCRLAKWLEKTFGRDAYAHLFVTEALKEHLVSEWGLRGHHAVLHDRPPAHFRRSPDQERSELLDRLLPTLSPPVPSAFSPSVLSNSNRPAILVSSTSWTADEDFTPFLVALDIYHARRKSDTTLPRLLVLITGKGALRAPFENEIAKREQEWKDWICVRCVFLPSEDYPKVLGCADLGVSMHSSSSGWDLPMKVVDMFGCGVPVLSRKFAAIGELVKDGANGRVWSTSEELGEQIVGLMRNFPENEELTELRGYFDRSGIDGKGANGAEWSNWDENWDRVVFHRVMAGGA